MMRILSGIIHRFRDDLALDYAFSAASAFLGSASLGLSRIGMRVEDALSRLDFDAPAQLLSPALSAVSPPMALKMVQVRMMAVKAPMTGRTEEA